MFRFEYMAAETVKALHESEGEDSAGTTARRENQESAPQVFDLTRAFVVVTHGSIGGVKNAREVPQAGELLIGE
ncbi:MAG: hypothetical protein F4Z66_14115 [Gammaproteobacteria bacterium]|nr:hypothetical protein [Gammaproteobacteria bacterium]